MIAQSSKALPLSIIEKATRVNLTDGRIPAVHSMPGTARNDYDRKLDELDRLLNDPDVPLQPALVWRVVGEVIELARHDGSKLSPKPG